MLDISAAQLLHKGLCVCRQQFNQLQARMAAWLMLWCGHGHIQTPLLTMAATDDNC
jgi:hypothetical protein